MNKLYLITGSSSGIGYAISKSLLEEGNRVIGCSRHPSKKIKGLLSEFPENFFFEQKDLSKDINELSEWIKNASSKHGRFSGFVHSAGIQNIKPLKYTSHDEVKEIFNVNLFSALAISKGISDKRVVDKKASIVFISSIASTKGSAGIVSYSSSKAALNGAMRSLAAELAPQDIRVNSILPGFVDTEMTQKWNKIYNEEYIENISNSYPFGIGAPEDIKDLALFLLDDSKSQWITGSEFEINGGANLAQ